jgi:hypothetical protein
MWGSLARGITQSVKDTASHVAPTAGDVLRRVGEVVAPPHNDEEEEDEEEEDEDEMGEGQGSGAANGAAKPLAVDNGDDALLLLKALAAHDEEVRTELKKGESDILSASCSIM